MPGQFINSGTNPFGNLVLTNNNNSGNLAITNGGGGGAGVSGQWYLATGGFGYQPAWTYGVVSWPMTSGAGGSNYGTTDPNEILTANTAGVYIDKFDSAGNDQTALLSSLVGNIGTIQFSQGANQIIFSFIPGTFVDATTTYHSFQWIPNQAALAVVSTSNTNFTGYPYGDNPSGGGPLTYTGSGIAPNNTELVTVTITV
jgi:hypothetical protein